MAKKQPEPAPVEAGEVATEQREESPVQTDAAHDVVPFPAAAAPTGAELSGPEVGEIRVRSEAVDKAQRDAQEARAEWVHKSRVAQYAQEALTIYIRELIVSKGLDNTLRYRVDPEMGKIVPVGPMGG